MSFASKQAYKEDVTRFHVRHAGYMSLIFIFLLIACLILLFQQYNLNEKHEDQILQDNFREHTNQLDNLLSRVTTRVQSMRIKAEFDLMESRHSAMEQPSGAMGMLRSTDGHNRFHLDEVVPPYSKKTIGNLTGEGPLTGRDPDFYREVDMALNLNPQFQASAQAVEDAAWVYYTSAKRLINIYPWVSSQEFKYSDELLTHEFFTLGTPARNPGRKIFWTEVYVDEYGKGLMTTCAVPVYDQNRFVGTVAIDLTVDFLNTKVKQFNGSSGIMFIVNDRQQLLAHPTLITSDDKQTKNIDHALLPLPGIESETLERLPLNRLVTVGQYHILGAQLEYAPWRVFFWTQNPSMWASYLNRVGMGGLLLIAGLLVLVVIIFCNTHFRFVLPSGKLVQFIMAHGQLGTEVSYGKVPAIWKPWFTKISQTFDENARLTAAVKHQNQVLEKRVGERTVELLDANRQLRRESEERLEAEKEKQRLHGKLQRAQKMEAIGMLAGGVAHDLNNVLSGLVSYPQLLLMDLDADSPLRKAILTIQKGGERAAAIVQDLLTLARRGVTVTEVVNLNDLVQSYITSPEFRELSRWHPGAHVTMDLAADLLNLSGSPVHLSKCIMNLVGNAAEAMPEGGEISVQTANRYVDQPVSGYDEVEEGDYVVLRVADTGVGMSPDDIERIFEPFYTKKVMGRSGTGLGMAVVWGAVKDHHGYIDIQSRPDHGTTFTLHFPATRELPPTDQAALNLDDYRGKGERVLVVDDVVEQRALGADMLQRLGYAVDTVASGEDAVAYVKDHKPDIIVLDMIMDPGMDGLETYRAIIEIQPNQKAIITSGFSETGRVREAQRLGVGTYVRKPYLIDKIAVAVRNELDKIN